MLLLFFFFAFNSLALLVPFLNCCCFVQSVRLFALFAYDLIHFFPIFFVSFFCVCVCGRYSLRMSFSLVYSSPFSIMQNWHHKIHCKPHDENTSLVLRERRRRRRRHYFFIIQFLLLLFLHSLHVCMNVFLPVYLRRFLVIVHCALCIRMFLAMAFCSFVIHQSLSLSRSSIAIPVSFDAVAIVLTMYDSTGFLSSVQIPAISHHLMAFRLTLARDL